MLTAHTDGAFLMNMRIWTLIASVEGVAALIAEFLGRNTSLGLGNLGFAFAALFVPLSIWAVVRVGRGAWPLAVIAVPFVLVNGLGLLLIVAVADSCAHGRCP